ncbi:MAG TPA: capsule assembly Wzi family protein [Emticicia sp.]
MPVSENGLEDYYRRKQLKGKLDSSVSFTIRPLFPTAAFNLEDGFDPDSNVKSNSLYASGNKKINLKLLPLSWVQQFNSSNPFGWNDGSMIPARGYQTMISAGFFARVGFLNVRFQPEYIYAANRSFNGLDIYSGEPDLPLRYGSESYNDLQWGQSSIRLNIGPASVGVSNENIWWGPGVRNAILLSNNATGFKHLTLNTIKPIRTPVGTVEGQIIAAKLENSGYTYMDDIPEYADWRYLSGMVFVYQPRWVPGLFLGLSRSFQIYHKNIKGFSGYFPFLTPFQKINDSKNSNTEAGTDSKDQLATLFARWMFQKAQAEVYFEYGVNDHAYNTRVFLGNPEASRAYTVGIRKLLPINNAFQDHLQVNVEVTQLSQALDRVLISHGAWYTHSQIKQGHTNFGEVLGAGVGPGGNLQSLDISWVSGYKRIGLQTERYVHNDDYYYTAVGDFNGMSRKWVDFIFSPYAEWEYNRFLIGGRLAIIKSLNYQWQSKDFQTEQFYVPYNNHLNFHGKVNLTYRF